MKGIALNFFPVITEHFEFVAFVSPYIEGQRPTENGQEASKRSLPVDSGRDDYWVLFHEFHGSTKFLCASSANNYLTIDALRLSLIKRCEELLEPDSFLVKGNFWRRVEVVLKRYTEGTQVICLEPYFLRSRRTFGFLADFHFHPEERYMRTRRSLELSLAMDGRGRQNLNYYADRYSKLAEYVERFHDRLFPLPLPGGEEISVDKRIMELRSQTLDLKTYIVGKNKKSRSQFMGVKQSGPFKPVNGDPHLYFIYKRPDHSLSQDLYRALRGDTFSTFPGMESLFRLPFGKGNVSGIPLEDYTPTEIERIRDRVIADGGHKSRLPIILTPFSRHDPQEKNSAYWSLKHAFLSAGLPLQVVSTTTVANREVLKWSAASIGLQVFAKLGGTPWRVEPRRERSLIVGIGQAHRVTLGRIERFFAYSVLSDSSGVFEEVRVLGDSDQEGEYLTSFGSNLEGIIDEYSSRFDNFTVHATFSINRRELDRVGSVLDKRKVMSPNGELILMKFNERNRFFGFAVDHNTRVPYESSVVRLGPNEFIVWFEGLQYGQRSIHKQVGRPLHVQFMYPSNGLTWEQQKEHLQEAINLSGANWRGFNAKSLPVSVYYARLIAMYLKEFEGQGLPSVSVDVIPPWFL